MNKVYEGGIPTGGFHTNLSEKGAEAQLQPDCECDMASPAKVGLGSVESHGGTGKDVNPPAEGEVLVESKKVVTNQPV